MSAASSGRVMMCTGIPEEKRQNELFLVAQKLGGTFIRDKVTSKYQTKTTMLVVGELKKTEKFLCGLAAGIPLVDTSYVFKSQEEDKWIEDYGKITLRLMFSIYLHFRLL